MRRSIDRDAALERRTIAAHGLYIASLAEVELRRRFVALRDLLESLGYVPRGLDARLPPEPDAEPLPTRGRGRARPT